MKVLVAEDDRNIREGLVSLLAGEGYQTVTAGDGREALDRYRADGPHLVLLDIMMPQLNGYEVCRLIRAQDTEVPIIFLSAKSEEIDRVLGLELGADDFIVKPFGVKEVVARIRAVTRRCLRRDAARTQGPPFTMAGLEVFPDELRARRQRGQQRGQREQTIDLSLREVGILKLLHEHRGRVVDRDTFFDRLWGLDHVPNSRTLDQQISKLRKRIEEDPADPRIIRTVHGIGYRFDGP
jgi:DNA-binding response OmpR family regulator